MKYTMLWKVSLTQVSNLSGMIGLIRRAGKIKFGSEQTVDAIRSYRKPDLVCLASDASANTVKKITDGCKTHHVELVTLPIPKSELGRCIGRAMDVSVVAVMDASFRLAVLKQLEMTNAGGAIHGSDED